MSRSDADLIAEARKWDTLKRHEKCPDYWTDCNKARELVPELCARLERALAQVAALREVLQQAVDSDALAEWFTDTERDGIDVRDLLAATQAPSASANEREGE